MDVLSETLRAVRLQGALFYNGEFSSPWSVYAAGSQALARYFQTQSEHVIVYHLLIEGRASVRLDSGDCMSLEAGDIVVIPHGDRHVVENGHAIRTMNDEAHLADVLAQGLKLWRVGGGGEITRFLCGYMACDPRLGRVILSGLPQLFKINIRMHPSGAWLENSIRFLIDQQDADQQDAVQPGREAVLTRLSEVLFVETLRAWIALLPAHQTGWLAGARDAEVGKALALMHRTPAHPWTIASLAKGAGVSRSVLAERFRHYLNQTPMAYLTHWRLQLAAQMLTSTNNSVLRVAADVGYESEAAFNRAFKREFEVPPARFRSQSRFDRQGS